jgi:hypothetical protein
MDGTAVKEQFFRERGLARVGMAYDGKRTTTRYGVG